MLPLPGHEFFRDNEYSSLDNRADVVVLIIGHVIHWKSDAHKVGGSPSGDAVKELSYAAENSIPFVYRSSPSNHPHLHTRRSINPVILDAIRNLPSQSLHVERNLSQVRLHRSALNLDKPTIL